MVDLAMVIVSYNVRDILRRCLDSIERSVTGQVVDVWVVDSGSADGTPAMIRAQYPWINLIESENVGFSRGNNLALRQLLARSEPSGIPRFVLLLNPDTELPPGAVTRMVQFMDSH